MKLNDVLYPIVEQIAQKLEDEEEFAEDPELYTVALLLVAKKELKPGRTIGQVLEEAMYDDNLDEARKLLKRKKVAPK
ncbi:MAG: hypothetical protein ACRDF4_04235 [Rhabdochlamydiaceae bacterium]